MKEYPEKTTDLSQVAAAGFEITSLVVICADCIGSYKFNYHMVTITSAPVIQEKILVILDNLGWYCDVTNMFIRQRQIQIVT
jgi:hypothetical protein